MNHHPLILLTTYLKTQASAELAASAALWATSCVGCKGQCSLLSAGCPPALQLIFLRSVFISIPLASSLHWCMGFFYPSCRNTWGLVLILVSSTLNKELLLEVLILRRGKKPSSAFSASVEDLLIFKSEHLSAILSAYYLLFPGSLVVSFHPHHCL